MTIKEIEIDTIDRGVRLRATQPTWVDAFAEQLIAGDELPPIEVVERAGGRFRLIAGAHRLEAHVVAGRKTIVVDVKDPKAFADDDACVLREIKENFYRAGLTELDRCVGIAEWKTIFEAEQGVNRGGRPAKGKTPAETAEVFFRSFSTVASSALGISERSVRVAVEIAKGIGLAIRARISAHPITDRQNELAELAKEPEDRQSQIVDLLLDPTSRVDSVAEAIARIDRTAAPSRKPPWEKLSDSFSRLTRPAQIRFFEQHADAITLWLAERAAAKTSSKT